MKHISRILPGVLAGIEKNMNDRGSRDHGVGFHPLEPQSLSTPKVEKTSGYLNGTK